MRCPHCRAQDQTRIEIHLKDEKSVEFFSCRSCETKWWRDEAGESIALNDVLALAAQPPRVKSA